MAKFIATDHSGREHLCATRESAVRQAGSKGSVRAVNPSSGAKQRARGTREFSEQPWGHNKEIAYLERSRKEANTAKRGSADYHNARARHGNTLEYLARSRILFGDNRPRLPNPAKLLGPGDEMVVRGRRWFRKSYGNTYSTAQIEINGKDVADLPPEGGYGDQYLHNAAEWLNKNGYVALERSPHGGLESLWRYCAAHGIKLDYYAKDVKRERDL